MKAVSLYLLEEKLISFLMNYFNDDISKRCAEVILWAELHNKEGQGFLKLTGTEPLQNVESISDLEVLSKSDFSKIIKTNKQPSFYSAQVATDEAIKIATNKGFALVGLNGIHSSTGALGFYAERIAKSDLIGLIMARSPGSTAPFNMLTPLFGTNPLAIGFPTEEDPLIFDMATSAITWYELVLSKLRNEKIPDNVAIDKNGNITTDPNEAMHGGILPFDLGHKSSGLSMMVEIMSGPLVGASYCDYQTFDKDWGMFILAFKPDLLVDLNEFKSHCSSLIKIIKEQPSKDGNKIRIPGDSAREFAKFTKEKGSICIEEQIAELIGL